MDKNLNTGFTLIESIVTIVVLSIIAFSTMYIMTEGFKVWWANKNYIELRSDGRFTLARLAAEFRQAEEIPQVEETNISFNSDIDNDGDPQLITYTFNGTELIREEGPGQAVICANVSSLILYWNSTNRLLTVDMTLTKQDDTVNLETDIAARCLP